MFNPCALWARELARWESCRRVVVVVVVVVAVVAAIDVACVVVEYGALSPVFGNLSMVSSPLRLFLLLAVVGFLGVLSYGAQNRRVF